MRVFNLKLLSRLGWAGNGRAPCHPFPGKYPYRIAITYFRTLGARGEILYQGKPTVGAYSWLVRYLKKNETSLRQAGSTIQYREYIQNGILISGNIRIQERTLAGQCVPGYNNWKFMGYGVHPVDGRMHLNFTDEVVPFRHGKHTVMVALDHVNEDQYEQVNGKHIATNGRLATVLRNCIRNR